MGAVALRVRYVIPDIYEHYGHMDKKNFRMLDLLSTLSGLDLAKKLFT